MAVAKYYLDACKVVSEGDLASAKTRQELRLALDRLHTSLACSQCSTIDVFYKRTFRCVYFSRNKDLPEKLFFPIIIEKPKKFKCTLNDSPRSYS